MTAQVFVGSILNSVYFSGKCQRNFLSPFQRRTVSECQVGHKPLEHFDYRRVISEDMSIALHDSRIRGTSFRPAGTLLHDIEFTDVRYHPRIENLFVTTDQRGDVCLRDTRMSFDDPENRENSKGIVQKVSISSGCSRKASRRCARRRASRSTSSSRV